MGRGRKGRSRGSKSTGRKVTIKKRSGRVVKCPVRKGKRGGEYIVTRKKGGGTEKRYV